MSTPTGGSPAGPGRRPARREAEPDLDELAHVVLYGLLPPPTRLPCNECPWRRDAIPGHLGPHDAQTWIEIAHSESPIHCHQTITRADMRLDDPDLRQCRGASTFRANVLKRPRNPTAAVGPKDPRTVFASNQEFVTHHDNSRTAAQGDETA